MKKGNIKIFVVFYLLHFCCMHGQNEININDKKHLYANFSTRIEVLRNPFETDSVLYDPNAGLSDFFVMLKKETNKISQLLNKGIFFTSDSSSKYEDVEVLRHKLRSKYPNAHTNIPDKFNQFKYTQNSINTKKCFSNQLLCDLTPFWDIGGYYPYNKLDAYHNVPLSDYWKGLLKKYSLRPVDEISYYVLKMEMFYIPLGKVWLKVPNYKAKNKNQLFVNKKVKAYFITDILVITYVHDYDK